MSEKKELEDVRVAIENFMAFLIDQIKEKPCWLCDDYGIECDEKEPTFFDFGECNDFKLHKKEALIVFRKAFSGFKWLKKAFGSVPEMVLFCNLAQREKSFIAPMLSVDEIYLLKNSLKNVADALNKLYESLNPNKEGDGENA